jgi:hypothetical protein
MSWHVYLFISKKRRNPFYDPDRDVPSSSFLNSEDTPIASEMH